MNHVLDEVDAEAAMRHAELAYQFRCSKPGPARYAALQALYRGIWPEVKKTPAHRWTIDPNLIDWSGYFSPIEAAVWGEIRAEGAVLYPQHPVGRFFVDFGNPRARVGIECDGKQWHTDKAKDAARQKEIEAYGWRVYRLTGRQCFALSHEEFDGDGCEVPIDGSAQELIREVCKRHGISPRYAGATA